MPKPVLGLVLGALLGLVDGASAYLYPYPEVRAQIVSIIIGSTFKGVLTGLVAGVVALKFRSLPLGIGVGLLVGLTLSYLVAAMPSESGQHYYFEIMLPGAILGAIAGFATQRYGRTARVAR
ncbi:MAG: hypothetical protein ACKVU1_03250 [bacterium]